jgi:glutamine synthetase
MAETKTSKDILDLIREEGLEIVDLRLVDFPGLWQHFLIPAGQVTNETFENDIGFDGSSIRGWQAINEFDMLVKLEPGTAFIDLFLQPGHRFLSATSVIRSRVGITRGTRAISPARRRII